MAKECHQRSDSQPCAEYNWTPPKRLLSKQPPRSCLTQVMITLNQLTGQVLELMKTHDAFTFMSATSLLKIAKKDYSRIYDILSSLQGLGLLTKDIEGQYTCNIQYCEPCGMSKRSRIHQMRVLYRYVRNNPGVFSIHDLAKILHFSRRNVGDMLVILEVIGSLTKEITRGYYKTQSDLGLYWKQRLDNIWASSNNLQVVQSGSLEIISHDSDMPRSDSQIIQSDSHDFQFVHTNPLPELLTPDNQGSQSTAGLPVPNNATTSDFDQSEEALCDFQLDEIVQLLELATDNSPVDNQGSQYAGGLAVPDDTTCDFDQSDDALFLLDEVVQLLELATDNFPVAKQGSLSVWGLPVPDDTTLDFEQSEDALFLLDEIVQFHDLVMTNFPVDNQGSQSAAGLPLPNDTTMFDFDQSEEALCDFQLHEIVQLLELAADNSPVDNQGSLSAGVLPLPNDTTMFDVDQSEEALCDFQLDEIELLPELATDNFLVDNQGSLSAGVLPLPDETTMFDVDQSEKSALYLLDEIMQLDDVVTMMTNFPADKLDWDRDLELCMDHRELASDRTMM